MNKPISLIHTPCKNCIFAMYDDNVQIGCDMDYLDKYRKTSAQILEVYDNDKEFFVINDKKCLGYRDDKWREKQEKKDIEYLKQIVVSETRISYIAIIQINNNDTIDIIKQLVKDLIDQSTPPDGILFYKKRWETHNIQAEELMNLMCEFNIKWRIQNFIDKTMSDMNIIISAIKGCPIKKYFYIINTTNRLIPNNCIVKIQKYIDNTLNSIGCINIHGNLFLPGTTLLYCYQQNILLLDEKSHHINYETLD